MNNMVLIACVDDNNGLLFNNRRLSSDINVVKDISLKYDKIICSDYSYDLLKREKFSILNNNDDLVKKTNVEGIYFIEDVIPENLELFNKIILYCWNRNYPSDLKLNINFDLFELQETINIDGNSHDIITKTIYKRK